MKCVKILFQNMMKNNTIMKSYKWDTFMGSDTYLLNEIIEE